MTPRPKPLIETQVVSIRMPRTMYQRIQRLAEREKRTATQQAVYLLEKALKQEEEGKEG